MTKLTKPQQRYLDEIRAAGEKKYNGRARKTLEALEAAGLVEVEWDVIPARNMHGDSSMWSITVRPVGAIEVRVGLAPPRNPNGNRQDRNWTVIIARSNGNTQHVSLYGTRTGDPEGAQIIANQELLKGWGWTVAWEAIGTGFKSAPFTIWRTKEQGNV